MYKFVLNALKLNFLSHHDRIVLKAFRKIQKFEQANHSKLQNSDSVDLEVTLFCQIPLAKL